MKKLKIILVCSFISLYSISLFKYKQYKPILKPEVLNCTISEIKVSGALMNAKCTFKGEKMILKYKFKNELEKNKFNVKDFQEIKISGTFEKIKSSTIPFNNVKENYNNDKIYDYYIINEFLEVKNPSGLNKIKYEIFKFFDSKKLGSTYKLFILGQYSNYEKEDLTIIKNSGLAHLIAIGGLHIAMIELFLLKLFKRIIPKSFLKIILFLIILFYAYIINFPISLSRIILMQIIKIIFKDKFSKIEVLIFSAGILLIVNPLIFLKIGFQFSYLAAFVFIKCSSKKYIEICIVLFLVLLPLQIYYFSTVNFLTPLINFIFVPFFTIILFPLLLLTLVFPVESLYIFLYDCFISVIDILYIAYNFRHISLKLMFFLEILIILSLVFKKYLYFIVIFIILFNQFNFSKKVIMIDVGQGDSFLIKYPPNNFILIDTGGLKSFSKWQETTYDLGEDRLIPFFKKSGVNKFKYVFLSHNDFDHVGEFDDINKAFKINKTIRNDSKFTEYKSDDISIEKLNTYDKSMSENENSMVFSIDFNNHSFLFTGDLGFIGEKKILSKLKNHDFLKVGHHGSKNSTSDDFLKKINPKYALISVGKNNMYKHPSLDVLERLEDVEVFRTDQDGTVIILKNRIIKYLSE